MTLNEAGLAVRPTPELASLRILVIDDEPANTRILERLLENAGYTEVRATNDPLEGMALCETWTPDLLLLDLHMPEVDGYVILRQVAEPERGVSRPLVVVLTADVTRVARERALGLGATDFLTKPFDHLEALLRIHNHLATRRLELDIAEHAALLETRVAERTAELQQSMDRLRETLEERRVLAVRLVTAQEEERRRIAADIHDDTIQTMVAVGIRLELLMRQLTNADLRAEMDTLRATVSAAMTGLRHLLFELRPASLERAGLVAALEEYLDQTAIVGGPAYRLEAAMRSEPVQEERIVLYRIAQEALVNVRKHAAAKAVSVVLADDGEGVRLEVRDDGRGFAAGTVAEQRGHLGLPSMRERAELAGGWCRIESAPGAGTTVRAWIPLSGVEDDRD
jgi:signal transduction histidine kinase